MKFAIQISNFLKSKTSHIFAGMDYEIIIWIVLLFFGSNLLMWIFYIKILEKRNNPGLTFLYANIVKDVILIIFSIKFLPPGKANFLILSFVFIISSFAIYYKVIKRINAS